MTNKNSLGYIKKIGIGVLLALFLVLAMFIQLQTISNKRDQEDKLILDIFGKQRMYTQMIAKDSSILYALIQDIEDGRINASVGDVENKYQEYKGNLRKAEQDFSATLMALNEDCLPVDEEHIDIRSSVDKMSPYLKEINLLWEEFHRYIQVMIQAESITDPVVEAATFINLNNMRLLELSDQIQQVILAESIQSSRIMATVFYILIGILSAIVIFAIVHLLKFIILPFNRLYKGISDIGLEYYPINVEIPISKKSMPILVELNTMFLKIQKLISLIEEMNSHASFPESLNYINKTFSRFIPYNYIGIALLDETGKHLRAFYGVSDGSISGMPEKIAGQAWLLADTSLGELIETGEARIINDLEEYCKKKPPKLYNKIIMDAGIQASITLPLKVSNDPVGIIFFSSTQKNVYKKEHINFLKTLVNSIAISFHQNIFINDLVFSSILALAKLAEARDEDTGDHLDRMKMYSRLIAELLYENEVYPDQITPEYFDLIERFSPLHDIGKVGIRDSILLKPGKLTKEEYEEMKHHTKYGASVLRAAEENIAKRGRKLFGMGIEIAEGHHEKWDGSGYPEGKKGEEIPLCARIVAVADVFDALTSKRPYKEAYPFDLTMSIMEEGRGKHFDPNILDIFLSNRNRVKRMYEEFVNSDRD